MKAIGKVILRYPVSNIGKHLLQAIIVRAISENKYSILLETEFCF